MFAGKAFILLMVICAVRISEAQDGGYSGYSHEPNYAAQPYNFQYGEPHHQRSESSDGQNVKGEYRVALPDGRMQVVTYLADGKNGFTADVKYTGEPKYPAQSPSYGGSSYVPAQANYVHAPAAGGYRH